MGLYPTLGSNPSLSAKFKCLGYRALIRPHFHPPHLVYGRFVHNSWHRLCCSQGDMDTLAKVLFPHYPKVVRFQKLHSLYLGVLVSAAACTAAAVTIFLYNLTGMK